MSRSHEGSLKIVGNSTMKALVVLIVLGVLIYFVCNFGNGRILGPLSPPLSASYHESILWRGIVVTIGNHSNDILYDLKVKVEKRNGTVISADVAEFLKPADTVDVGWMQLHNTKLEVGDSISIYAKGYPGPYVTSCSGMKLY